MFTMGTITLLAAIAMATVILTSPSRREIRK
jgi:hypothetical protein